MQHTIHLSLIEGVTLTPKPGDVLVVEAPPSAQRPRLTLKQATPSMQELLALLQRPEGVSLPYLIGRGMATIGPDVVGRIRHYIGLFSRHALLCQTLMLNGETPLATMTPVSGYFYFREDLVSDENHLVLSRFAYCHNQRGSIRLGSPRGFAGITAHHPMVMNAFHHLRHPTTPAGLLELIPELVDAAGARLLMNMLVNAGVLIRTEPEDATPEDAAPELAAWSFHDLLFHASNRLGRHADPYGGTFPFRDRFEPPPAIRASTSEKIIPLPKPDMTALINGEEGFSAVLERRQTIRDTGDEPMTLEQLGEFLYRSARVKKFLPKVGLSWRPSPGGGAIHELEIFPVIERCNGLERGIYHYDPHGHGLSLINRVNPAVEALLMMASMMGKLDRDRPDVLLVFGARFQRVQMKYQSVAYSVMLKNVGCLYQTMYLVATAMGLAPVALGGGNSDLFCQAAGTDYYAESSVGEFILCSGPSQIPEPLVPPRKQTFSNLSMPDAEK